MRRRQSRAISRQFVRLESVVVKLVREQQRKPTNKNIIIVFFFFYFYNIIKR